MKNQRTLSENMEDYLEVILDLEQSQKVARAKDIADRLKIQRGSVTGALKSLEEKGYINYEPYSFVTLTEKGKQLAGEISKRHQLLRDFLVRVLQVDEKTADSTACRLEHVIDEKSFDRIVRLVEYIYKCPRIGEEWLQSFLNFCQEEEISFEKCDDCIDDCHEKFKKKYSKAPS